MVSLFHESARFNFWNKNLHTSKVVKAIISFIVFAMCRRDGR